METDIESRCSLCIFCLKSIHNSTDDCYTDTTGKSDQYKFFTLIFRHFLNHNTLVSADNQEWCRNACKVISEITINGDDNALFFENVQICSNCEQITQSFCDLYHQIKELELRIDWQVDKLWRVMSCVDKTVSKLDKDELEKATTNGGVVSLGEFRNTLKQSCQAYQEIKKKNAVPNVQLVQIIVEESPLNDVNLEADWDFIPSVFSPIILEECPSEHQETQDYPSELEDNQRETIAEDKAEYNEKPAERALILHEKDPLYLPPNHSRFTCSTCSIHFNSKFQLFQHNISNHIGKYFSSVRPTNKMSDDQFSNYIANLLKTTINTLEKVDEKYKCPFCSNLFSGRQSIRNHLVVKHRSNLKEKLVELQKSENDPLKIDNSTTTLCATNSTLKRKRGWPKGKSRKKSNSLPLNSDCSHCSLAFPDKYKLFQHDISKHPEKYFVSVKLKFLTSPQFQNCVAQMLSTSVDEFYKVDGEYQCNYCSKIISAKQYIQSHLVRKHRSVLKDKLVELQKSSNVNEIMNARGNVLTFHCSICSISFKTKFGLFQHDLNHHVEKYFSSVKLKYMLNDQFKANVINLLRNTVEQFEKVNSKYQCSFCPKLLCGRQASRVHLVKIHRQILNKKLIELQESLQDSETPLLSDLSSRRMQNNYDPQPTCNICGKVFRGGYLLNQHQSFNHPEIFFEDGKPIELQSDIAGDELYSKYVRYIINKQVDQEFRKIKVKDGILPKCESFKESQETVTERGTADSVKYKCNFCTKSLCSRKFAVSHLVLRHRRNMVELLKGKSVEEIKLLMGECETRSPSPEAIVGRKPKPELRFDCTLCSKAFKGKLNLIQHDLRFHIEKYFLSAKLENISIEQFKKCIAYTLRNCLNETTKSKFQCVFCSKQCSGIQNGRYHLVVKHRVDIENKLMEIQNCESVLQNAESSINASDISLKRKGGWPKGKSRLLKNPSLNFNFESANVLSKTKRRRRRPRGRVIDHVPVFRRQRVSKVSRCGGCGKKFVNVYTLRTHLKGYCKVLRDIGHNLDDNTEKNERMDVSGIADLIDNNNE